MIACCQWKSSTVWYPLENDLEDDYVLLVGDNGDRTYSKVWHKFVVNSEYGIAGKWAYTPLETYNAYYLPTNIVDMVYYAGLVMAFTNLGEIYLSSDGGITWKTYKDYFAFPKGQELPGAFLPSPRVRNYPEHSQSPPTAVSSGTRMWSREKSGAESLWQNKTWR